jgi:hypothetical protein
MIIVRYADDIVVGFEHESDARRFWDAMRKRLEEFSLSLHPDKTRTRAFAPLRLGRETGHPGTQKSKRRLEVNQTPAELFDGAHYQPHRLVGPTSERRGRRAMLPRRTAHLNLPQVEEIEAPLADA